MGCMRCRSSTRPYVLGPEIWGGLCLVGALFEVFIEDGGASGERLQRDGHGSRGAPVDSKITAASFDETCAYSEKNPVLHQSFTRCTPSMPTSHHSDSFVAQVRSNPHVERQIDMSTTAEPSC